MGWHKSTKFSVVEKISAGLPYAYGDVRSELVTMHDVRALLRSP